MHPPVHTLLFTHPSLHTLLFTGGLARELRGAEEAVVRELTACQGPPVDVGGYWLPDAAKAARAMRPSATLNRILGAGAMPTAKL